MLIWSSSNSLFKMSLGDSFPIKTSVLNSYVILLLPLAVLYVVTLLVYRLYYASVAKFPGPRLAAITFFYEFYYDVWLEGRYTWKIQELHKQYGLLHLLTIKLGRILICHPHLGPFVRINPCEVHCNDPEFFDVLYVNSGKKRTDKSMWAIRQSYEHLQLVHPTALAHLLTAYYLSPTRDSAFKTIEHDLHKMRRNQLSPFFSKASIRTLEPLLVHKVDKLCTRLEESCDTNRVLSLTHAFVALTLDIISRVCFGYSYGCLEQKEFASKFYEDLVSSSRTVHLVRQFPWFFQLIARFPRLASNKMADGMLAAKKRQMEVMQQVKDIVDRHARNEKPPNEAFTVFDAMLDADVPPHEKSVSRLTAEALTLTAAGSLTTANTLDATIYYLLTNPTCLACLRQELDVAIPDLKMLPTTAELEKLPYLTAVIHEALRLGKGVPHRLARVSPDVSYRYREWVIPRGAPISMSSIGILEHPGIFPDPHNFIPERWLPFDAPEVRHRRKYLIVFGGGSRMCLGLNLAWAELYLTVAAVVRRFGGRLSLDDVVFDRDLEIVVDGFNPLPSRESKGLRVLVSPKTIA